MNKREAFKVMRETFKEARGDFHDCIANALETAFEGTVDCLPIGLDNEEAGNAWDAAWDKSWGAASKPFWACLDYAFETAFEEAWKAAEPKADSNVDNRGAP